MPPSHNSTYYYLMKTKAIDARVESEADIFGKAEFETMQRRHRYLKQLLRLQLKEFAK